MNDDPEDALFEAEMRALRPTAASRRLENGIADLLATSPPVSVRRLWWEWLGFARPSAALGWGFVSPAAVAAVTLLVVQANARKALPSPPTTNSNLAENTAPHIERAFSARETQGARAANVVYAAEDEGVVPVSNQEPMRRVRYRSTDHVQWRNPRTGAQWEVSYPREDVLLVPINAE